MTGHFDNWRRLTILMLTAAVLTTALPPQSWAQTADTERIAQLEQLVNQLQQQVEALARRQQPGQPQPDNNLGGAAQLTATEISMLKQTAQHLQTPGARKLFDPDSWLQRFTLGGYGEIHANFTQGTAKDVFDLHRLVLYVGYEFADWIRFHSELEVEHALVKNNSGGYLSIEQAHVDFLFSDAINIRFGRLLTPLGIINKTHEPTTFNGVERPNFEKYIIPSTWSSDGIGVFGALTENINYEAYLVGGLNGSGFSAKDGIRGGRLHERPSLHDIAITGRLDYQMRDNLRLGVSGYAGGLNNTNNGGTNGIAGNIRIASADFELSLGDFDFRGVIAHADIDDTSGLPAGVAEQMFGWYLEGAYHFWPEAWRKGKLANADAIAFIRYESYDTQSEMPTGVAADPTADRTDLTLGLSFKPITNFVVKTDYQFKRNAGASDPDNAINVGMGWEF